jgi:hypothetical protein
MVTGLRSDKRRLEKALELGADQVWCSEDDPVREVRLLPRVLRIRGPLALAVLRTV